jgi:hypothetical protein
MRDRTPLVVILAAFLAFLGVKSVPSGSSVSRPEAPRSGKEHTPAPANKEIHMPPADIAARAEREFWGPLVRFVDTAEAWKRYTHDKTPWSGFPVVEGWKMHGLLALMPDPRESNAGYRFDSLVDALQRAVETSGYVLDRHFFPWPQASPAAEAGQPAAPEAKKPLLPSYERQPGVLLFRDNSAKRLLVVLLVGETATAGIHKQAFTTSLDFLASLNPNRELIPLLGPAYSGSQNSLEQAIKHWATNCKQHPPPRLYIISGTATALDRKGFLKRVEAAAHFQATAIPERVKLKRLLRYLRRSPNGKTSGQGLFPPVKVACLCESNTSFGGAFTPKLEAFGGAFTPKLEGFGVSVFPFPLHISEIRSAYVPGSDVSRNTLQLPALGGRMRIPFDTGPDVRETEPTFAPAMSAVISERVLATILSTLAREHFRYVAIVATDVRDKLVLATLVRQFCPETRLLFTGNDLLLSHPEYSYYLKGSLVASTYPLFPMNQRWSFPFRAEDKRLFFPSEAEYGYYNAAIALLNRNKTERLQDLLEYGPPLGGLTKRDQGRPPVWISIIGQNGPQPLDILPSLQVDETDAGEDKEYVFAIEDESPPGPLFSPQHDALWMAARLAVTLFVAFVLWSFVFVLWRHRQGVTAEDEYHGGLIGLLWPRSPALQHAQRAYVWRCLLAVFILFAYLALVCDIPAACRLVGRDFVHLGWTGWLMPLMTVLLLGAFPVLVLWKIRGRFQTALPAPPNRTFGQFVGSLSLVHWASLVLLAIALFHLGTHLDMLEVGRSVQRNLFFYERTTNLGGGISPVVPVVFLGWAFVAWSWCQLKRLYLLDRHSVPIPFNGNEQTGPFNRIHARHVQLDQFLREPHQVGTARASVLMWMLLFFVLYRFADSYVPTVEGVWYDTFLFLGLALFCLVLVYALMQVFQLWRNMHELLRVIAPLRLKGAFSRVPSSITRLFGPYLTTERPGRETHLPLRQEQQQRLQQQYGDIRNSLKKALGFDDARMTKLDTDLDPFPQPPAAGTPPTPQDRLRDTARACLDALDHLWRRLPVNESFGGPISSPASEASSAQPASPPALEDIDARLCQWLMLAEEFVATEVIAYLSQFFVQLRNLLVFLTVSPIFMLLAATSYPFHPQRLWMMVAGVLILAAVFIAVTIFIQIERDEVVSRISGTRPNKLDFRWDFLANLCTYVLPLLGVLLATSTDLADLIHAWLDPLFQLGR